jgi:hypothetical protein
MQTSKWLKKAAAAALVAAATTMAATATGTTGSHPETGDPAVCVTVRGGTA